MLPPYIERLAQGTAFTLATAATMSGFALWLAASTLENSVLFEASSAISADVVVASGAAAAVFVAGLRAGRLGS